MRAAHEIEMKKRVIAETRLAKLKAKIARFQAECDDLDEEDDAAPVGETRAETDAEPIVAGGGHGRPELGTDRGRPRGR